MFFLILLFALIFVFVVYKYVAIAVFIRESIDINSTNHYPRSLYGERLFRNDPFRLPITFSTHAPHAGSDFITWAPPAARKHFYPRSPCGERRRQRLFPDEGQIFYPRSPCGSDVFPSSSHSQPFIFLSTLPMRGATVSLPLRGPKTFEISIHAPPCGSD